MKSFQSRGTFRIQNRMKQIYWFIPLLVFCLSTLAVPAFAESQENDYKGISDPFGDPSSYEFSDDEAQDKEFFHLGRFMMLGLESGVGIFNGGLGTTTEPALYAGMKLLYFFDKSIALELAAHFARHLDSLIASNSTFAQIQTDMIPVTAGIRYYFDTRSSPKALAIANPYLAVGPGAYLRLQNTVAAGAGMQLDSTDNTNFGLYAGGGIEFLIYRKHIYLGIDARYHMVFFLDEGTQTLGGMRVDRSGDYMTLSMSLTYSF